MRIFIYEYTCGGGMAGRPLDGSIAREGWAMLAAVASDFARLDEVEVVATLDERLVARSRDVRLPRLAWVPVSGNEAAEFRAQASAADWTLVVAPEFERILIDRVRWAEASGTRLLCSSSSAVEIAGDQLRCGACLRAAGVNVPASRPVRLGDLPRDVSFPAVLKPRDGAGSQCTFLIRDAAGLESVRQMAAQANWPGELLLQPYVLGVPASVACLVGPSHIVPLLPAAQHVSDDGRFRYLGGHLPLDATLARRAVTVGVQAVQSIPGLGGYVGVDAILADDAARDVVIDVNPRLTTSFVGLRALAQQNLAESMLQICSDKPASVDWRPGEVRFRADGAVVLTRPD